MTAKRRQRGKRQLHLAPTLIDPCPTPALCITCRILFAFVTSPIQTEHLAISTQYDD
jgi:hypothetical protein